MDDYSILEEAEYQVLKEAHDAVLTELVRLAIIRVVKFAATITTIAIVIRLARRHQS